MPRATDSGQEAPPRGTHVRADVIDSQFHFTGDHIAVAGGQERGGILEIGEAAARQLEQDQVARRSRPFARDRSR